MRHDVGLAAAQAAVQLRTPAIVTNVDDGQRPAGECLPGLEDWFDVRLLASGLGSHAF
jgi:hypothetical protein